MKQNMGGLLERYRDADGNTRLNLYLQYRDLRTEFIEVDRCDLCRNQEDHIRHTGCCARVQKNHYFAPLAGCMRRLCRGLERRTA